MNDEESAKLADIMREELLGPLAEVAELVPHEGKLRWPRKLAEFREEETSLALARAALQLMVIHRGLLNAGASTSALKPLRHLMEAIGEVMEGGSPSMLQPRINKTAKPNLHFQLLKDLSVLLVEAYRDSGCTLRKACEEVEAALGRHKIKAARKSRGNEVDISAGTIEDWREELRHDSFLQKRLNEAPTTESDWSTPQALAERWLTEWKREEAEQHA